MCQGLAGELVCRFDHRRDVDCIRGKPPYQYQGDEGNSTVFKWLPASIMGKAIVFMSNSTTVLAYISKEYALLSNVQCGSGGFQLSEALFSLCHSPGKESTLVDKLS